MSKRLIVLEIDGDERACRTCDFHVGRASVTSHDMCLIFGRLESEVVDGGRAHNQRPDACLAAEAAGLK